jgi:hypothetical protein
MKRYLAKAMLERHLATLPSSVELKGQKRHLVCGVLPPVSAHKMGRETLDFNSLAEFPHKIFVNWPATPEGIVAFTRKYGLLDPIGKYCGWRVRDEGANFSFRVASWRDSQDLFRQYWDWNANWGNWNIVRHDLSGELIETEVVGAPNLCHPGIEVTDLIELGRKPFVVLTAQTLWQHLCTLLMFHDVGELRYCKNSDCPAPRFMARRKDQVYCSDDCSSLLAKRKWWASHGEEWRRERAKKKRRSAIHKKH